MHELLIFSKHNLQICASPCILKPMNAFDLSSCLEPIVKSCRLWAGKNLQMIVIANPVAGGFTRPKINLQHQQVLQLFSQKAAQMPGQCAGFNATVYPTEGAGKTKHFVQNIVKEACLEENLQKEYLLVAAGGDGTFLEVQTTLAQIAFELKGEYEETIKKRLTVLRLPFGTGNDGADGDDLEQCLNLLVNDSHFALQRAVRVNCSNAGQLPSLAGYDSLSKNPPWYSFNIASIGIDAFITHMTNRTKNVFPGDFYKIWIDLACIFYGAIYKPGMAKITMLGKNGEILQTLETGIEYALLGVSGHRTYGSKQKILPDDNNVCVAKKMSLLKKMAVKEKVKNGEHAGLKQVVLASAEKLSIEYDRKILVQMDGEAHLLSPENFPIIIERTEPIVRIIVNDAARYDKGAEACIQ